MLRLLCQTYGITGSDNLQGSEEGKRTNKEKRVQRERSEEVHLEKVEQGSIREEKVEIGLLGWLGGGVCACSPHPSYWVRAMQDRLPCPLEPREQL